MVSLPSDATSIRVDYHVDPDVLGEGELALTIDEQSGDGSWSLVGRSVVRRDYLPQSGMCWVRLTRGVDRIDVADPGRVTVRRFHRRDGYAYVQQAFYSTVRVTTDGPATLLSVKHDQSRPGGLASLELTEVS